MPSELESFGLAALEAMACEVVPIATRTGGVPEVIEHGVSGYLADVGDVDTMARYAIELLNDESAVARDGQSGARGGAGSFLLQQDRSAIRRLLPARGRTLFVKALRNRARGLQQRQANPHQRSLPFVAVDRQLRSISIQDLQAFGDIRHADSRAEQVLFRVPGVAPMPTPSSSTSITSRESDRRLRR